jgi:type VI secretion system secreted protein VgrG
MNDRTITLSTWLPDETLLLEHAHLREDLGRPFEFQLDLLSETFDVDIADALNKPMVISVDLPAGGTRYFNGLVTQFTLAEQHGEYRRYHATLRPWLWLLSRTANSKIFQSVAVPDVVKAVFRARGFSDFEDRLSGSYRTWDYLVQYRESDLNFVNRIMEQEGIYYFFEHDAEKHTLVLADSYGGHETTTGYEIVPFLPPETAAATRGNLEHVGSWKVSRQIQAGSYAVSDFNFETPRADLSSTLQGQAEDGDPSFEIFDYPGEFKNQDEGQAVATVDLQERQADIERAEGLANARGLAVGTLFTLADYPREDQNKEYLLVSTSTSLAANSYISGGGGGQPGQEDFHCSFTALDSQRQFRSPRRTPKPMVQGPQTAIVVGESGDEITVDQYGRVKVQFHWDRVGTNDENSSCWVRVAQLWAGSGWGGIHIPRIGQEVIVDFLEGDPDRPIITGRVYNADNMPPYALPDNKTQSGIKSRSTLGGAPSNFNELRFEDKKGSELVNLQAEKDLTSLVKHDEDRNIGHDRTTEIAHDETITVGNNRTESVAKQESITIGGDRQESVGKSETVAIGTTRALTVGTDESITVGGSRSDSVGKDETTTVGGNQSLSVGKNQSIDVGGGLTLSVAKDDNVSVSGNLTVSVTKGETRQIGKTLSITAADQITLTSGSASITLKSNGDITINGANITLKGSGKINIQASSDVVIKGSKVSQN